MSAPNAYADDLGQRDPLTALAETPERMRRLLQSWTDEQFERSYAPGKWSARRILVRLAQSELALTTRARLRSHSPHIRRNRSLRTSGCRSTTEATGARRSTPTGRCAG